MAPKRTRWVVIVGLVTSFLIGGFFVSSYPTIRMQWSIKALREWDGVDEDLFDKTTASILADPVPAIPTLINWMGSDEPTWPRAARLLAEIHSKVGLDPNWKKDLGPRGIARLAVGKTLGIHWSFRIIPLNGMEIYSMDGNAVKLTHEGKNGTTTYRIPQTMSPKKIVSTFKKKDSDDFASWGEYVSSVKAWGTHPTKTPLTLVNEAHTTAKGWVPAPWKTLLKSLGAQAAPHLHPNAVESNARWAVMNCREATE